MTPQEEQARTEALISRVKKSPRRNSAIMALEEFRDEFDAIPAAQRVRVLRAMAERERP